MTRPRLTRELVLDAYVELVGNEGEHVTLARLGAHLGVDPTAVYRHFRDKDELMLAAADRILSTVSSDPPPRRWTWRRTVVELCIGLRAAHLAHPTLAALARQGPPLAQHEFDLTERMLEALSRGGLSSSEAALAYHALIEMTVGSAALDAHLATSTIGRRDAEYRRWRDAYRGLDPERHPHAVAHADQMYAGTADDRFRHALERLLDGIAARAR